MSELTPAEYSQAWAARRVIDELTAPGLSPADSLAAIRKLQLSRLQSARFRLGMAQDRARNNDPAAPDEPGAAKFCQFCGAADPAGGLEDDSLVPLTGERIADPNWLCADTGACLGRRRQRYPLKHQAELQDARRELALAAEAARPAVLALVALTVAQEQQDALALARAQQAMGELLAPRRPAQSRPGPLHGEAYRRVQWCHSLAYRR